MCKLNVIYQERLKIEVKLLLESYMPLRLAQQRMTFNDLEWPSHDSSVLSVWKDRVLKELNANVNSLYISTTKKQHHPHRALALR